MARYDAPEDGRSEKVKKYQVVNKTSKQKCACAVTVQVPRDDTEPCQCLSSSAKRSLIQRHTHVKWLLANRVNEDQSMGRAVRATVQWEALEGEGEACITRTRGQSVWDKHMSQ